MEIIGTKTRWVDEHGMTMIGYLPMKQPRELCTPHGIAATVDVVVECSGISLPICTNCGLEVQRVQE